MRPPARLPTSRCGLTPLPCLATILVATAFAWANLGGSTLSTPYYEYGFPLTYRKHFFRPLGVHEFRPGALSFDVALAAVAVASTFVATRQWSHRTGRFQRHTVRGLMVTVAIFAVALAVLMAAPLLALAAVAGCLIFGFGAMVYVSVMMLFHRRARPSPSIRVGGIRE
jgi:hypothetical protein